ncbi:MAG: O-antigen ligase family protein [Muribaculaceae bacterium]|nr:O-antigen ligase family protein [Muribaculaceae bacterium]
MIFLNILYFLIISVLGYKWLTSHDGKILKSALDPSRKFRFNGPELFWCLTFSTGLLAFSLSLGVDLMAIRLLVLEVLCLIGLRLAQDSPIYSGPLKMYTIYILWIIVGIYYAPSTAIGIRVVLKYLYPIILCLFASAAVRDPQTFMISSKWARVTGAICIAFSFIPYIGILTPGVWWYATAQAIHFISLFIFSLGMYVFTNQKRRNLLWTILFALPCFIWVFRTSIMGTVVALAAWSFIRWRVKSLPVIAVIGLLGVISVFEIDAVREKMFFKPDQMTFEKFINGNITFDDVNTNTRAKIWKELEQRFYKGHEWAGSGTGTAQVFMHENSDMFGGLTVCHSDFVQQKCDNGLIGLGLYALMVLFVFADCCKTYWWSEDPYVRLAAITAGASLLGVYACFYSDNTVNYSMATLSMPFGFYGMMLGLRESRE